MEWLPRNSEFEMAYRMRTIPLANSSTYYRTGPHLSPSRNRLPITDKGMVHTIWIRSPNQKGFRSPLEWTNNTNNCTNILPTMVQKIGIIILIIEQKVLIEKDFWQLTWLRKKCWNLFFWEYDDFIWFTCCTFSSWPFLKKTACKSQSVPTENRQSLRSRKWVNDCHSRFKIPKFF